MLVYESFTIRTSKIWIDFEIQKKKDSNRLVNEKEEKVRRRWSQNFKRSFYRYWTLESLVACRALGNQRLVEHARHTSPAQFTLRMLRLLVTAETPKQNWELQTTAQNQESAAAARGHRWHNLSSQHAQKRHASKSMIIVSYGGARIQNIHNKIIRYAKPFYDQHFFRKELNTFTIWSVTCAEYRKWMSQQPDGDTE